MRDIPVDKHPDIIAGVNSLDDAGVYKLSDDTALIQTIDFFTPIVDDPFTFGQIAAANALSDVYAMGGTPLCAMNVVCFPAGKMDINILKEIIAGCIEKVHEAGAHLIGGHSVKDDELKFGLAVTGIVHPEKVMTNKVERESDRLVLTKPLGNGIINTAHKGGMASEEAVEKSIHSMVMLNRRASEIMREYDVSACTDVTGFGLLGHAMEMVETTRFGIQFDSSAIPYIQEAKAYAKSGLLPGGLHNNRKYREQSVDIAPEVQPWLADILYDPQTSGGLLIALAADDAEKLVSMLQKEGIEHATVIGEVVTDHPGGIKVT